MSASTKEAQAVLREEHRFVSSCVHCGKQMGLDISTYESVGPGQLEKRDVYVVWIDPEHDCTYLKIEAKDKAISA